MCQAHITRRRLLQLGGAATVPLLSGCDMPFDLVSDEDVQAMGLQAWDELRAATPVSREAEMQAALDRVAARLLQSAGEDPRDWEALVFASPDINAFALPGNKIGVHEGMFRVFANQDQLATVVGHEIGHLQADHSHERMNAQLSADWGLSILHYLMRLGGIEYAAEIGAALGLGVEYGLVLPYSRNHELEADRLGLITMAEAGYEPAEAVDFWRRMDTATAGRPPQFLATHPAPEARIEAIEAMLPEILRS